MNKIITVDITYRLKIEMAPGDDPKEILHEMDADFAWPETEAAVVSQEILGMEYFNDDDELPY
jgi:hypothetical protein